MMGIEQIKEPYKSSILEILNSDSDTDRVLHKLKVYMVSEPYFKEVISEPAWLAYEIHKQFNKRR